MNYKMSRLQLFLALRRHVKLSEKRSTTYEQNRTAKVIIYIFAGFIIVYMMFIAVMLSLIGNSMSNLTTMEFFFGLAPYMLVADFFMRFIGQQTPAQLIKPYALLPIPRHACVDTFILTSMVNSNNLIWMCITVPYAIMSILFVNGFWTALGFVVGFQLIIIINSQNYMLWRTLITRHFLWWLPAVGFYALLLLPTLMGDFDLQFNLAAPIGEWLSRWNPLAFLAVAAILAMYFMINRRVQYRFTRLETAQAESKPIRSVSQFSQLDRFGQTGEYIKIEIKSIMRNKNMRSSFIYSTVLTIILSALISFTDVYSDSFSSKFWMVYVFIINGAMLLVRIMGAEGNYIDGLMIHKENILQLFHAKYYFYSALLLLPFVIMLPTVFTGKYTLLQMLAMVAFAAGPVFAVFMQMAVWNKQTLPLNSKLVAKANVETNWFAVIAEMAAMFMPVVIISVLNLFCTETMTFTIMLIIGVAFIAARNLWLRNIYNRFMRVRYVNMESFRATR